jgi:hypothetical protein
MRTRNPRARKGLTDKNFAVNIELLSFHDSGWARVRKELPIELSTEADLTLRIAILACCSRFLVQRRKYDLDRGSAAALRRPKPNERAPFERLVAGLQAAADVWKEIVANGKFHDNRLGDVDKYELLGEMAQGARRQLDGLRKLTLIKLADPLQGLVHDVAKAVRSAGLEPSTTGRIYDETRSSPTWFQRFVTAIDKNFLAGRGLVDHDQNDKELSRDPRSTYDAIGKALRADYTKRGNPRKQTTRPKPAR